jgi:hypothetical protein
MGLGFDGLRLAFGGVYLLGLLEFEELHEELVLLGCWGVGRGWYCHVCALGCVCIGLYVWVVLVAGLIFAGFLTLHDT